MNKGVKTAVVSCVVVGIVAAAAVGIHLYKASLDKKKAEESAAMAQEFPEVVKMIISETGPFQRTVTAVGTVNALKHMTVSSEVSGKVIEVGFESGQIVEPGTVLVKLDSTEEAATLKAAEADRDLARVTLDRVTQAAAANAVSRQEIDKAKAELDAMAAKVDQLKNVIEKREIIAPFKGRMGLRNVHPGQYIAEGEMMTMLQGVSDEVYVDFSLPQLQAAALSVGSKVEVRVLGQTQSATVAAVESQIEMTTRNARLRATTSSMGGRLLPGAFVDVHVPIGEQQTVVLVPPTAVRRAPFGDYVFVIIPDEKNPQQMRAHQRFVTPAGTSEGKIIIAKGLEPGEKLAGDGSFKLMEGRLVMDEPPASPDAPASGAGAGDGKSASK